VPLSPQEIEWLNEIIAEAKPMLFERTPSLKPLQAPVLRRVQVPIADTLSADKPAGHVLGGLGDLTGQDARDAQLFQPES